MFCFVFRLLCNAPFNNITLHVDVTCTIENEGLQKLSPSLAFEQGRVFTFTSLFGRGQWILRCQPRDHSTFIAIYDNQGVLGTFSNTTKKGFFNNLPYLTFQQHLIIICYSY